MKCEDDSESGLQFQFHFPVCRRQQRVIVTTSAGLRGVAAGGDIDVTRIDAGRTFPTDDAADFQKLGREVVVEEQRRDVFGLILERIFVRKAGRGSEEEGGKECNSVLDRIMELFLKEFDINHPDASRLYHFFFADPSPSCQWFDS